MSGLFLGPYASAMKAKVTSFTVKSLLVVYQLLELINTFTCKQKVLF